MTELGCLVRGRRNKFITLALDLLLPQAKGGRFTEPSWTVYTGGTGFHKKEKERNPRERRAPYVPTRGKAGGCCTLARVCSKKR